MRFALIGRTEWLYNAGLALVEAGHEPVLVVSCKEAPEYTVTVDDFAALAERWGVPFVRTVRSERIVEALDTLLDTLDGEVPIALSINFSGVLPDTVISRFPLGVLNVHVGDLPRYRGNACAAWAILMGEPHVGLCVHRMIGGELDSGDIVGYDQHDVDIGTTITQVNGWMERRIPGLVVDAFDAIARNPAYVLRTQSKDPADALRCYPRKPEDGRIDWRDDALHIVRLINASNRPYSGAFCEFEGRRVTIWHGEPVEDGERFLAVPGQVTAIGDDAIEVATGNGKVRIARLECDGAPVEPRTLVTSLRARFT